MVAHLTGSATARLDHLPSWATLVRAPNPGPMTLDGTNTWVLRAPGESGCVVVDPGPQDDEHVAGVAKRGPVLAIVLTHHHPDHRGGLPRLRALCPGADLLSARSGETSLVTPGGLELTLFATPGHTADSISVVGRHGDECAVLTGDTILGRGTAIVAWPDGDLGGYLASLDRLADFSGVAALPGHGPALADCGAAAGHYREHRLSRLAQVREALASGARTAAEVVAAVYADVDRALWPAAQLSVRAQLAYLDQAQAQQAQAQQAQAQQAQAPTEARARTGPPGGRESAPAVPWLDQP